jgi:hypothetical protein
VSQNLGIAAHGKHFGRPERFEALALHLRTTDAIELASGRCSRKAQDEMRGKLVAGGLAGDHGNACHQRMIPRPGHVEKIGKQRQFGNGAESAPMPSRASSSFMPLLYRVL